MTTTLTVIRRSYSHNPSPSSDWWFTCYSSMAHENIFFARLPIWKSSAIMVTGKPSMTPPDPDPLPNSLTTASGTPFISPQRKSNCLSCYGCWVKRVSLSTLLTGLWALVGLGILVSALITYFRMSMVACAAQLHCTRVCDGAELRHDHHRFAVASGRKHRAYQHAQRPAPIQGDPNANPYA